MSVALLPGVTSQMVATPRLNTHLLTHGAESGIPVVFVHGNVSAARFFEETMLALPATYYAIAPDLRGFGRSETKPVDATRGLRDFADDLHALITTLALTKAKRNGFARLFGGGDERKIHLVGWSMGSGVIMQYALDHPEAIASLTLISPLAPYGFGGTKDAAGTLTFPDGAGSGGGTANPDFCKLLASGDRGSESPNSPRNVMNTFYFKPPFRVAPEREDVFVDEMLTTQIADGNYPGDMTPSANWPTLAPGKQGVNNAMAPTYYHVSDFARIAPRPPVLWVRGADDQIVSDASFFDLGTLGKLGFVPGWPGDAVFPSQPMVAQMRAVLEAYQKNGGSTQEVVLADCGHSPHIEKAAEFNEIFQAFLRR
jgi:pimeloyl-ACP methyl ester carboxylesterase